MSIKSSKLALIYIGTNPVDFWEMCFCMENY